jgi:hypothetical protein
MRRAFAVCAVLLLAAGSVRAEAAFKSRAAASAAFKDSWRFYKWRIEQGDGLKELEFILVRIRDKYAGARVNHAMVERELAAVRALKALGRAAAVGGQ